MIMVADLRPGDVVPLQYSPKARQRILIGLNWDARAKGAGLIERVKGVGHNVESHDMDLACVMYDADGSFVDGVSGRPEETTDQSGKVYHSGDDTTGTGDLDDETLWVELKDLPDYIHHIVVVVEMQSKHTFNDVEQPHIRLADGMTNENQFIASMTGAYTAFVFGRIFRGDGGEWLFHYIGENFMGSDIADWVDHLHRYV
jgi:stress response protein SCP2